MVTRIILVFNDIGFFEDYSVVVDLHCIAQPRETVDLKDSVFTIDEWLLMSVGLVSCRRWPSTLRAEAVSTDRTMTLDGRASA